MATLLLLFEWRVGALKDTQATRTDQRQSTQKIHKCHSLKSFRDQPLAALLSEL